MNQENHIINGKMIASTIEKELRLEADQLFQNKNIQSKLSVIILGKDPASLYYVRMIERSCQKVHVQFEKYELDEETSEEKLLTLIEYLNHHQEVHGIIIQTPLPKQINQGNIQIAINPDKDVDCLNPINMGKLVMGSPGFLPCTPSAVCEILKRENVMINGKHVVIIGRSSIVGKPLALMLLLKHHNANATVTVCHSKTPNLSVFTQEADIVVAAAGSAGLVKGNMIKKNTVIIDVGTNEVNGKLMGDVDFDEVSKLASKITPVPGGVGPVTNMMLMQNTIQATRNQLVKPDHS